MTHWSRADVRALLTPITPSFLPSEASVPIGEHGAVHGIHRLFSQRVRLADDELRALHANLERLAERWRRPQPTLDHPTWNPERGRDLLDIERVDLLLRTRMDGLRNPTLEGLVEQLEALRLFSGRWESDSILLVMSVAVCGHPGLAARLARASLDELRGPEWYRPWVEWLSGAEVSPRRLAEVPLGHPLEGPAIRSEWRALLGEGQGEQRRYDDVEQYDPDAAVDRPLVDFLTALARLRLGTAGEEAVEKAFLRWFVPRSGEPMLELTERVASVYLLDREVRHRGSPTELLAELRRVVPGLDPPISPTFEVPLPARQRLQELRTLTDQALTQGTSLSTNPVPDGVELLIGDEPGTDDESSFGDVL